MRPELSAVAVEEGQGVRFDEGARRGAAAARQQERAGGTCERGREGRGDENPAARPQPGSRHLIGSGLGKLALASLERRRAGGLQRREALAQAGRDELVDPFGLVQVLQLVFAQIAECHIWQGVVPQQLARRLRHQHLPAVAGRADSRGAMDAEADVALFADGRLARVDPHAHQQLSVAGPRLTGELPLRRDGGRDRILRARERDEERVALRVDLTAAVGVERSSQDPLVLGKGVAVEVAELLEEPRRPFDVREEERDGPAGELGH